MKKLLCKIGWHSWCWKLGEVSVIVIGEIPDCAKCERCGISYRKGVDSP